MTRRESDRLAASHIGAKLSTQPSADLQSAGGMTIDECRLVLTGSKGTYPLSIRVFTHLGTDGSQAIEARNMGIAREQQWKQPGARLEESRVGEAICILTGRPSVASHAICSIPRGEGYLEIDVGGDVSALPALTTVGALAQKAFSRL